MATGSVARLATMGDLEGLPTSGCARALSEAATAVSGMQPSSLAVCPVRPTYASWLWAAMASSCSGELAFEDLLWAC